MKTDGWIFMVDTKRKVAHIEVSLADEEVSERILRKFMCAQDVEVGLDGNNGEG